MIPGNNPPLIYRVLFPQTAVKSYIPVPGFTWPAVRYNYELPYEIFTVLYTFFYISSIPETYNPWVFKLPLLDSSLDPYTETADKSDYNYSLSIELIPRGVVCWPRG